MPAPDPMSIGPRLIMGTTRKAAFAGAVAIALLAAACGATTVASTKQQVMAWTNNAEASGQVFLNSLLNAETDIGNSSFGDPHGDCLALIAEDARVQPEERPQLAVALGRPTLRVDCGMPEK